MHDKVVAKVNNIDTVECVLKTKYNKNKSNSEKKKILILAGLLEKTNYRSKTSEIESKIPSTSGLATTSALTAVENKISEVRSLVKQTDYNTKINETEKKISDHNRDKCTTTPEFNNFTAEIFAARLAQANLVAKTGFDTKLISLNKK